MKDYYDVLGVPRDASQDDIKASVPYSCRTIPSCIRRTVARGDSRKLTKRIEYFLGLPARLTTIEATTQGFRRKRCLNRPAPTSSKKPTKRRNYWVGVLISIVTISLIRLAIGGLSSSSHNDGTLRRPQPLLTQPIL